MERALTEEATRRIGPRGQGRGRGLLLLEAIGTLIGESGDLRGTLERIVALVAERLDMEVCSIYRYDAEAKQLHMVVTRGLDKCLFVFPMEEWTKLSEKVSALPLTDVQARDFRRLLFSGATDAELDKQGRVLLPQYLREYAGLNSNVIVAGLNTHMEIWAPEAWNTIRANIDSAANVEQWANLGI